ncbi:MAG: fibronectin type III domain-containing protein [Candidatus Omnitrophota bacterium]
MKRIIMGVVCCCVIFFMRPGTVHAATYYVDGAMANDAGNGTSWGTAKKYIYSGIQLLGSGDTLIIKDGTYTGNNNRIRGIPSGSAGHYTTVKAENDFGVILSELDSGTAPINEEGPVNLYHKSYVTLQGFVIKNCTGSSVYAMSAVEVNGSDHCRLMRIGIKNGVWSGAEYGGGVNIGSSTYCLIEDVFVCGMARYSVLIGGGSDSHHNIARRVVVRWDYCTTAQPRAAIVVYGGFSGEPPNDEILLQNCIALDGNDGTGATFTGGFSAPHETSHVHRYGCISLKNHGYGFHSSEDSLSHDNSNTHCLNWDSDNGMWWRHLASGISGAYNCTSTEPIDGGDDGASFCEAVDNIMVDGVSIVNMSSVMGTANLNTVEFSYIVRSPQVGKGATIEKRMGTSGTLYGEVGYDTLSGDSLWPWPYEDALRDLFRETNDPPAGVAPLINITTRGFCADGTTLTKYIWEYLGNTIPAEIYVVAAPSGLTASVVSVSAINLAWTDNSGIEEGFKLERKEGSSGTYSQIADLGQNVTSYSDTGLSSSTTYYYRVRAYSGSSNSLYSNEVFANTGANTSGSTDSGGGGGGGCFIATAVYGSYDASEVKVLRLFRDKYLLSNGYGKRFVEFYYRHSPELAKKIYSGSVVTAFVRIVLEPVIWLVKKSL